MKLPLGLLHKIRRMYTCTYNPQDVKSCLCVDGLCNTQNLIWKTRRVERNHRPVRRCSVIVKAHFPVKNHEKNEYMHTHSLWRTTFNENQNNYLHTKRKYCIFFRLYYVKNIHGCSLRGHIMIQWKNAKNGMVGVHGNFKWIVVEIH